MQEKIKSQTPLKDLFYFKYLLLLDFRLLRNKGDIGLEGFFQSNINKCT